MFFGLGKRGLSSESEVWAQEARLRLRNCGLGFENEAQAQALSFGLRKRGMSPENKVWARETRFRLRGCGLDSRNEF